MLNVNVKCKCQMLFSLNSMDLRGKKRTKKQSVCGISY